MRGAPKVLVSSHHRARGARRKPSAFASTTCYLRDHKKSNARSPRCTNPGPISTTRLTRIHENIGEQAVVEVVKQCAEDFMFDKRIFALVENLIEEAVVESVGPIASDVYYKAIVSLHKSSV